MMLSSKSREYTVLGKNLKTSITVPLEREDTSGQTSSTSFVSTGNKAKTISCSLVIEYDKAGDLTELTAMAEAVEKTGDPTIYIISDVLANAMNIKQVYFDQSLTANEGSSIKAWDIKFTLREYKSTAEKKEERELKKDISAIDPYGKKITCSTQTSIQQNVKDVIDKVLPA